MILISLLAAVVIAAGAILTVSAAKKSIPEGVNAVENFELQKYLGRWYEIARLDFKWERNLSNVTADYSLNDDGTVRVENRGYNYVKGKPSDAIGKAKFVDRTDVGMLKVSFFGPFYSGYNVV